jgi:hypothetical protein
LASERLTQEIATGFEQVGLRSGHISRFFGTVPLAFSDISANDE